MLKMFIAFTAVTFGTMACTGSRTMYDNNGLTIIQAGADPTPINGGYNVLIAERDGVSTIIGVTATGTVAEQIAMPAAIVGGAAVLRPDKTEIHDNSSVSAGANGGNSNAKGGRGGRGGTSVAGSNSSSSSNSGAISGSASSATGGSGGGQAPGNSGGQGGNGKN